MNGTPQQIAEEIIEHLGGNRFHAMVGPKHLSYGTDQADGNVYLTFQLPRGSARNKATHVKIKLVGDDHYEMAFIKCRTKPTYTIETISQCTPIPENLREFFTRETGLECTLGTMGK